MKLFVLFLILTLYSAKQRVSVSLFFPINIIHLLGKNPYEKISLCTSHILLGGPLPFCGQKSAILKEKQQYLGKKSKIQKSTSNIF